jgi:hypothetical protein
MIRRAPTMAQLRLNLLYGAIFRPVIELMSRILDAHATFWTQRRYKGPPLSN